MPRHPRRATFSAPLGQPQLAREERRALGAYYTPPEIVRLIVELTLEPLLAERPPEPPRVIDPACGAGEFLAASAERLARVYGSRTKVYGLDLAAAAIQAARRRLGAAGVVRQGNALLDDQPADGTFDVVIGNPPYLSIRQLAKSLPAEEIEQLRQRFRTARGNFDLYVLFIERALALLQPGGRCGLIVPNKWATLDYARTCRELLLEQATIEHVVDLSNERVFQGASVYPHVLVFRKQPAPRRHVVTFRAEDGVRRIVQSSLSPAAFSFSEPLDVESRVATKPLGELAKLSCGTAGYAAQRIARRLVDDSSPHAPSEESHLAERDDYCDFITSGNIDRYAVRLGGVRYLGRTYERPRLPLDAPEITPAKRHLFESRKIVIAGMSRRIEAAWDERGLALGVQVFAASEPKVDAFYLLALLNSKLLSYLFATRFAAKRLAGGYLAINNGQLERLPVVVEQASPLAHAGNKRGRLFYDVSRRLAVLGRLLSGPAGNPPHEAEADRLVYQLYRLSRAE
ncbi:MAG TPA: N-6 DNA methylase, partial [Pirellulaceae bacterium]|nr:N-6 DNA methylase [Pirellulaceae bacterium]